MALSVFAAAAEAPDRLALVTDREHLTYARLADRVRTAVAWLRANELVPGAAPATGPGSAADATAVGPDLDLDDLDHVDDLDALVHRVPPVALVAENDPRVLEMLHALIALGVPVLPLHPRLTDPERRHLLGIVRAAGVVGPEWRERREQRAREESGESGSNTAGQTGSDPAPPPDDERPLAIIGTSGTTGASKGVVLSRRAFAASAEASAANLGWTDADRWLLPLPLAHVGGLSIVTRCLAARRAVVLAPGADPAALVDAARRHRATLLSLVPTLLARILDLEPAPEPPPSIRGILVGGAAASPVLIRRARAAGWPVLTTYGLTEACSQVATQRPGSATDPGSADSGRPLPGIQLRIGVDEAIEVRGPTLFSGYLPDDTAPRPPDRWLPTGDRGRLDDDGLLHVLGRADDVIVSGGENVDPVEVEAALEASAAVAAACVFGVPDPEWGQAVCAAVVPAGDEAAASARGAESPGTAHERTEAAVRAAVADLRGQLAPFKLPRRIALLDALPTNETGKVDRRETARRATPRLRPV